MSTSLVWLYIDCEDFIITYLMSGKTEFVNQPFSVMCSD